MKMFDKVKTFLKATVEVVLRLFIFCIVVAGIDVIYKQYKTPVNNEFKHIPVTSSELQQKHCIEEALHFEARGEGSTGLLAVLSVLQNRKNSGRWLDSWCSVVHAPWQFSYRNGITYGEIFPKSFEVSEEISRLAQEAFDGNFQSIFDKRVMFYHNTDVNPSWATKMQKVAVIGNHVFYKERAK